MLSKNKIKLIRSLSLKKNRDELKLFVAEGNKLVADLLPYYECVLLAAKPSWMATQGDIPTEELLDADGEELRKASFLKTPQDVLAIFRQPDYALGEADAAQQLILALDGIQDPGNLGTIVRIADWYGIQHVVCSQDTADIYNPKTVQATMGALARVKVHYTDLSEYFRAKEVPVYGTFLDGEDIYSHALTPNGIIVMGNEGNGIRPEIESCITERLFLPSYPPGQQTSESLNVAVATAVCCAEFRRRMYLRE